MMGEELLNVFIIFIAPSIFNIKIENECYEKMEWTDIARFLPRLSGSYWTLLNAYRKDARKCPKVIG
jgi:hypothetical protein